MTNAPLMSPTEILSAVDRASSASDRWLMVAAFVIAFLVVGWLVKYLSKLQAASDQNTKDMLAIWRQDIHGMNAEIKSLHTERVTIAERYAGEVRALGHAQMEEAKQLLRCYAEALASTSKTMGQVEVALRDVQHQCQLVRHSNSKVI